MEGQCAGEKIVMVVPPEYGYGDKSADKVNISKPLYSAYKKLHHTVQMTNDRPMHRLNYQ